ncbi:uncharacterized protein BDW70DRAFT_140778 [Aspergillus foveolatus]|uniref:uncharacterized protein n=1 Tax=Aspergillus foveolatus TaxID=210207 RepID=UPI003CCCEFC5
MSDPDRYTVGWICALQTEYVAARAFFDKKHSLPETLSPNDNNHYTLGKIGGHQVVIAVLPYVVCLQITTWTPGNALLRSSNIIIKSQSWMEHIF